MYYIIKTGGYANGSWLYFHSYSNTLASPNWTGYEKGAMRFFTYGEANSHYQRYLSAYQCLIERIES